MKNHERKKNMKKVQDEKILDGKCLGRKDLAEINQFRKKQYEKTYSRNYLGGKDQMGKDRGFGYLGSKGSKEINLKNR